MFLNVLSHLTATLYDVSQGEGEKLMRKSPLRVIVHLKPV